MKKIVAIAALLVVLTLALGLMQQSRRNVALQWDYDYSHDPPCTSSLTRNCVLGFSAFIRDSESRSQEVFVPNRFGQNGQVLNRDISTTLTVRRYGDVQFCVTAVGVNASGRRVESLPTCVSKWVLPFRLTSVAIGDHMHAAAIRLPGPAATPADCRPLQVTPAPHRVLKKAYTGCKPVLPVRATC